MTDIERMTDIEELCTRIENSIETEQAQHDISKSNTPVCAICGKLDCPYRGGDIMNIFFR